MTEPERPRCPWAQTDPLFAADHDSEWGVPEHDGRALREKLMLDGFQAGLTWMTILRKRDAFRAGFARFDPVTVARFGEDDVVRLLGDAGIVRSRAEIEATIGNARAFLAMQTAGEDFAKSVWSFIGGAPIVRDGRKALTRSPGSEALPGALKKRGFKFVGQMIVYAWMQVCGLVHDHEAQRFRRCAAA